MTKTPVRNANWGFSFDEYEACFCIWKKKKPKDFAKQRTGGVVTDLRWAAVRRSEAKAIRVIYTFIGLDNENHRTLRSKGPGVLLLTLGGLRSAEAKRRQSAVKTSSQNRARLLRPFRSICA